MCSMSGAGCIEVEERPRCRTRRPRDVLAAIILETSSVPSTHDITVASPYHGPAQEYHILDPCGQYQTTLLTTMKLVAPASTPECAVL